uniref:Uncharacterized protein n=1 Tax=Romanomermis culicivorax TaxID=13658 RepID=A0A915L298_ROMCU
MTLGMGELELHVSPLACNIALSVCLAVGLVVTASIKADLRRQHAETKRFSSCEENAAVKTCNNNLISRGSDQ